MTTGIDEVQSPYFIDIRIDYIKLKEVVRYLTERADIAPPLPPSMPSLDMDSLVPNFCTLALVIKKTGIRLNIIKSRRDNKTDKDRKKN